MLGRKKAPPTRRPLPRERSAAPVFSYRANRSTNDTNVGRGQESTPKPRKSSRGWWKHIPTWIALGVIAVCMVYATLLRPQAKIVITNQPTAKEELQPIAVYQSAANQILGGLANRSKLTIDPDRVAQALKNRFPELKNVTVTITLLGKRPVVTLQPVQPALVINGNGGGFVIDSDGKAIARTSDLPKASKTLPQVTDQSGLEIKTGQRILPQESVAFITTLVGQLQAKKLKVSALILPPVANELDVRVDGQPYVIKTNLVGDARLQAGMYLAAKAKFEADKTIPAELVDTRVEERVYYK